jgi:hypothetical protein
MEIPVCLCTVWVFKVFVQKEKFKLTIQECILKCGSLCLLKPVLLFVFLLLKEDQHIFPKWISSFVTDNLLKQVTNSPLSVVSEITVMQISQSVP